MQLEAVKQELQQAQELLTQVLADDQLMAKVDLAAKTMSEAIKAGKKIISAGNGGSHCDAMHFAEELTGRYRENRPSYPAIAISDVSHLSCVSNDFGYDYVFSRYLEALGQAGDVFVGITTSGNSANIIEACKVAKNKGMIVVGLLGKDGGKLVQQGLVDIPLIVPHFGYADRIQEIHIKFIHIMIMLIEQYMTE